LLDAGRQPNTFPEIGAAIGLPSAGLKTSVNDLAQFLIWNFSTLKGQDHQVLDLDTLSYMQRIHWAQLDIVLPSFLQGAVNTLSNSLGIGGVGLGFFRQGNLVMHGGGFDGYLSEIVIDRENEIGVIVLANSSDAPVSFNSQHSISTNLLEIIAPGFTVNEAEQIGEYSDYRNIYTENNFFKYIAIPRQEGIDLYDLLSPNPMSSPVKLIPTNKKDSFIAPEHKGVYQREFEVLFIRDINNQVTSMQLQVVTLNATL
jgi:CubicO group peptidase (beta-lactamase class C family)